MLNEFYYLKGKFYPSIKLFNLSKNYSIYSPKIGSYSFLYSL